MTHSFMTSKLQSPKGSCRSRISTFMCEVIDFDNESHDFYVEASDYAEANVKAEKLAVCENLQINFINIYKF